MSKFFNKWIGVICFSLLIFTGEICLGQQVSLETKSFVELAGQADWACMELKMTPCVRPDPIDPVGIRFQYWEPTLFMETVKKPGDYVIRETGVIVKPIAQKAAEFGVQIMSKNANMRPTSTASSQSLGGSNLQFNEVHIYDFPLKFFFDAVCPSLLGNELVFRYISEVDSDQWRRGTLEPKLSIPTMNTWGRLYPRTGFMTHFSSMVASASSCMKAVSIAGDPLATHVVESKLDFGPDLLRDKVQMVYPYKSSCMPIGQNLNFMESKHSKDGRYVWIFWRYRDCCRGIDG